MLNQFFSDRYYRLTSYFQVNYIIINLDQDVSGIRNLDVSDACQFEVSECYLEMIYEAVFKDYVTNTGSAK